MYHATRDPRSGVIYAAANHFTYGATVQRSSDGGKTWKPAEALDGFVGRLAHRIAAFPAAGHVAVKDRVNAISLAPLEDFRSDSDLFRQSVSSAETQRLIQAAMKRGLQTREAELELGAMLGVLGDAGDGSPDRTDSTTPFTREAT